MADPGSSDYQWRQLELDAHRERIMRIQAEREISGSSWDEATAMTTRRPTPGYPRSTDKRIVTVTVVGDYL